MNTLSIKENIKKAYKKADDLQALPSIVMQVNNIMKRDLVTVEEISKTIEKDMALTSKILRLANSSYYGLSYKVNTLSNSIAVLGFETIRNLAVTVSLSNMFKKSNSSCFDVEELWQHSLGCAIAAKALACKSNELILQEKAFICGIIHDIGKMFISKAFHKEMNDIIENYNAGNNLNYNKMEKEMLGFTHSEIGAFVVEKWLFPHEMMDSIKYHHAPRLKSDNKKIICAVYAGNEIAKILKLGRSTAEKARNLDNRIWEVLDISKDDLIPILPKIKADFDNVLDSLK